jgi:ribosomal protein L40E
MFQEQGSQRFRILDREVMEIPKYESSNTYAVPAGVVFNAAAQAVQYLPGWRVKEINPVGWYITAAVAFGFWSYGENIIVQLTEPTPGQPVVNASSSSVFAIFDFGKNRRNIDKLFVEIQNLLAQSGYSTATRQQTQAPMPVQQQAEAAAPEFAAAQSSCPNCGARLGPDAKFCTGCGQQITR